MRAPTTKQLRSQCWRLRFIAFAVILITSSGAWLGKRRGEAATIPDLIRAGRIPAQLDDVPSHNRRYRASLLPPQNAANDGSSGWTLRLQAHDGTPVSNAALEVGVWMPEEPSVSEHRLRAIAERDGFYRLEKLRFDRPGWWNVKLSVKGPGVTDSLAFNLMIP